MAAPFTARQYLTAHILLRSYGSGKWKTIDVTEHDRFGFSSSSDSKSFTYIQVQCGGATLQVLSIEMMYMVESGGGECKV